MGDGGGGNGTPEIVRVTAAAEEGLSEEFKALFDETLTAARLRMDLPPLVLVLGDRQVHVGTGLDPRDRVATVKGMVEQYDRDGYAEGFLLAFIARATVMQGNRPVAVRALSVVCLQRNGRAEALVETFTINPLLGRTAVRLPYGPDDVRREFAGVFPAVDLLRLLN